MYLPSAPDELYFVLAAVPKNVIIVWRSKSARAKILTEIYFLFFVIFKFFTALLINGST